MRDRRLGVRIPLDLMLTATVDDRPLRALVLDLCDTGVSLDVVAGRAPGPGAAITVELALPGQAETLWIAGAVCYERPDTLAAGLGVRFTAMATRDARRLRDFCLEQRHRQLGRLLARLTAPRAPAAALAAA
jgi:c-di-GMP-binding flagellar brake protein YcgR